MECSFGDLRRRLDDPTNQLYSTGYCGALRCRLCISAFLGCAEPSDEASAEVHIDGRNGDGESGSSFLNGSIALGPIFACEIWNFA